MSKIHLVVVEDDYADMVPGPKDHISLDDYQRENMRARLVCPDGVDDSCRYWMGCSEDGHPDPEELLDDDPDDVVVIHGVRHRYLDFEWMTPVERCSVEDLGYESGEITEVPRLVGWIPGVYPVEFEWDDSLSAWLETGPKAVEVSDEHITKALAAVPIMACRRCGSHEIAPNHDPCCSSHGPMGIARMCHWCYSRTHFVETGCCGPQYAPAPPRPQRVDKPVEKTS